MTNDVLFLRRTRWAGATALLLFWIATLTYPGGTSLNPEAIGYSFSQNFLSDLMSSVAWNGQRNRVSAVLAGAGMAMFAATFVAHGLFITGMWPPVGRHAWTAVAAMTAGTVACLGLVGVALAAPDRWLTLHLLFVTLSLAGGVAACLLLSVSVWRNRTLPRGIAVSCFGAALALVALFAMRWGPPITTPRGLTMQVVAQKAAALVSLALFFYQNVRMERHASSHQPAREPPFPFLSAPPER